MGRSATRRVRPRAIQVARTVPNLGLLHPPGRPLEDFPRTEVQLLAPPICAGCRERFEADEDRQDLGYRRTVASLCALTAVLITLLLLYPNALKDAVASLSDRPPNTFLPPTYDVARPPIPERTPSPRTPAAGGDAR